MTHRSAIDLHVLVLPSFYPNRDEPTRGIFFKDQALAVRRSGARVSVLYPHLAPIRYVGSRWFGRLGFRFEDADEDGLVTFRVHGANPPLLPRLSMRVHLHLWTRLMRSYVRRHGAPDVLHAHGALWAGEAARRLAQAYRLPYIVTEHSTRFELGLVKPWQHERARLVFEQATVPTAMSERHARTLMDQFGLDAVGVVPNVVDTALVTMPDRPRSRAGFQFLSIGFLTARKGMDVLIAAFAAAFHGRDDVTLAIGGDGPERDRLERLARASGLGTRIRFLGSLSREQVAHAMREADCFVLASHAETFGVVLVEALASGIPVIATRCGGPEEFVTPDTGLLVEPGARDQLAHALRTMTDRARTYDPHALRSSVTSRFGPDAVGELLLDLYGRALASAGATQR